MEEKYSAYKPKEEDPNNDLTDYSEYFLKDIYHNEEELLSYVYSIIEACTINNCIDNVNEEYLKVKTREIRWLATKSRFRAKSNLSQKL